MKAREIRNLTPEEMRRKLEETKQELFNLRFQHAIGQLENKARLRQARREIARLETVLKETTRKPESAKA
ncbi:MAG: 50S ribosomal protein L29 [Desulfobacterales bacterium]